MNRKNPRTYGHNRQLDRLRDNAKTKANPRFEIRHADTKLGVNNLDTDLSDAVSLEGFHTEEVTEADLSNYHTKQLEARLNYYEREYIFERNPQIRAECKREVDRTRNELARRKAVTRAEAEQMFCEAVRQSQEKV